MSDIDEQQNERDENDREPRDWKKLRKRLRTGAAFFVMAAPGWWPIVEHFLP
ncbi:hypothetical protein WCD74_11600 [Actinomycetospora sp. OC33-EN08]|uniref:Uncharacterized protein n=1 Tax=Actinomycetospora aurantiaca TaxID=3129233 RepID=A0ABU8MM82_9PSEU